MDTVATSVPPPPRFVKKPTLVLDREKVLVESFQTKQRENAHQIYLAVRDIGPTYPTVKDAIGGATNCTLATISTILIEGLGLEPEDILKRPLGDFFQVKEIDVPERLPKKELEAPPDS